MDYLAISLCLMAICIALLKIDVPYWEKYDNLDELNNNTRMRAVLGLYGKHFDVTNPNEFSSVKQNTQRFTDSYNEHIKHRDVANAIYALSADCEL